MLLLPFIPAALRSGLRLTGMVWFTDDVVATGSLLQALRMYKRPFRLEQQVHTYWNRDRNSTIECQ
jgi:hypothetical protein